MWCLWFEILTNDSLELLPYVSVVSLYAVVSMLYISMLCVRFVAICEGRRQFWRRIWGKDLLAVFLVEVWCVWSGFVGEMGQGQGWNMTY